MNPSVAQALADAFEHYRHGRFSEAEAAYRRVLERAPGQPDALHRLGILARQRGRHASALELIDRAIAADPRQPAYFNDAGIVLHALGRVDDAVARFRKALSIDPDHAGAQNNLANVLRERGELAEALRIYRRAVELRADSPQLWYNLGNALADQRTFDEAAAAYRNAISLRPQFELAHVALADALVALGRPDEALAHYARALVAREAPGTIARFVGAFVAADLRLVDRFVREAAVRALSTPWARPADLAGACIRLLESDDALRRCIDRATAAWPGRIGFAELCGPERDRVFADPLLRTLLETVPACEIGVERMLTLARFALLDAVLHNNADEAMLDFGCALARQCFVNDYVFSEVDDERARALVLCERIAESLRERRPPSPAELVVVACYFPLSSLPRAEALISPAWPPAVAALVVQQVREPLEERRLRAVMPQLTPIGDGTTQRVRAQYEEHPYPRWVKLPPPAIAAADDVASRALWRWHDRHASLAILVAGCGTGQESIEIAQAFPNARVLAVDLSLASLAYAERKRRELRVENLEHAQADLTRLAALARRFDLISSVGVLHHLADPEAGLCTLASMLAPAGRMLVGLYSARSRADVVQARTFIAERGYRASSEDIRRCRQDLLASTPDLALRLARRSDFYVTGECRDLLFHVQEHRFTLSQIGHALDGAGLVFDGFVLPSAVAAGYASQFPDDRAMTDLANWDRLEAQVPDAFAGMYVFWARKAA